MEAIGKYRAYRVAAKRRELEPRRHEIGYALDSRDAENGGQIQSGVGWAKF